MCVIGGVRVYMVIRDRCRHGHTCRYWASCIDPVPDSTDGGGGGSGGGVEPDERRGTLITVSTDPSMLT